MSELWLLNPQKGGKKTMAATKRRKRRRSKRKTTFNFGTPKRRRRRRSRRRVYASNPVRRRRYRRGRSYRRNPVRLPTIRGIAGELGWAGAGLLATKVVGNFTTPMVAGIVGEQPIMKVALRFGIAYVAAWGLSSFFGQRVFVPAMIGGSMAAVQDLVTAYVAPSFPMLAEYNDMGTYYEPRRMLPAPGMGDYMGDGLSPDHDAVV